jgi:ligand-binding sensor domain-containing protein/two-component sensor histidine kinase
MLFLLRTCMIWLFATVFFVGGLQAQAIGIRSEYYSLEDGLSARYVTGLQYLEPGFLWVATQNGLNRFEGYDFVVFDENNPPPNYISRNNIRQMLSNEMGHLVLSYDNAPNDIDILDPVTSDLISIKLSPINGFRGIPRGLFADRDHRIFLSTLDDREGLRVFELDTLGNYTEVFHLQETYERSTIDVNVLHLMDDSFLINDEEKGLRWYSKDGTLLKAFTAEDFLTSFDASYPARLNIMYEDIHGRIWLSFHKTKGLFLWEPMDETIRPAPDLDMTQSYLQHWEDPAGNVLFSQSNGNALLPTIEALYLLDMDDEWHDFSFLLKETSRIFSITSSNSFFQDVFLGMDTGLKVVRNKRSKVETLLADELAEYLRGAVIRGVEEDTEGNIYFAREVDHWYRWNNNQKQLDTLALTDSLTNTPLQFSCSFNIQFDATKEYLWGISCNQNDEGQLHKMNPQTGKVITYTYHYQFTDFYISRDETIWLLYHSRIGTSGLLSFDPSTGQFQPYFSPQNNILANTYPRIIIEDSERQLWIGTDSGLFQVDPNENTSSYYGKSSEDNPHIKLSSNTIYEIYEDKNGLLWLGTTEGINILDPVTDAVQTYDVYDGLPHNTVCGFVPDDTGNYWVATYAGLSYFDTEKKTFKNFFKEDGLTHNEFNRFSHHRAQDGMLYFGTVNGLNIIDPIQLLNDSTSTEIFLTKFSAYDRRVDSVKTVFTNLGNTKVFEISPYVSYFQFDFALNGFVNAENNRYSVKLEGVDKDYSFLGQSHYVRYNKVPAGRHKLYIRGAHSSGNWSKPVVVEIIVKKFFYQTPSFILSCVLFLGLIAYGIFRYILNQQIRMERLRTKISSDLHDEVSGLLAGIAIQSDILKLKNKDKDQLQKLRQIGEVSRKAISKMSDVIWSIDSRNDRVEDLLQRMKEHLHEVLEPKDIDYYIETLRINPKSKIPVNVRQDLYLIFKEAINNVAKHSDATEVRIRLSTEGKHFKMMVQDNGSGKREYTNGHTNLKKGQGMANMRMRAHRLKGDLVISSRKGYMINLSIKKFGK